MGRNETTRGNQMNKQTQYLLSLSKTELAEKMESLKVDINEADEKYQQA